MLADQPIQVYLEAHQDRALRRLAKEHGVSLSQIVRESIDLWLEQTPVAEDPAWQVIDIGASDTDDLGQAHDEHLASSIEAESA